MDDMGIVRTAMGVESHLRPGIVERPGIAPAKHVRRFRMANGGVLERSAGYAILHAGGEQTTDEAVFARPRDRTLPGARTLDGLDLRIDPRTKQLVAAGPTLAARAA